MLAVICWRCWKKSLFEGIRLHLLLSYHICVIYTPLSLSTSLSIFELFSIIYNYKYINALIGYTYSVSKHVDMNKILQAVTFANLPIISRLMFWIEAHVRHRWQPRLLGHLGGELGGLRTWCHFLGAFLNITISVRKVMVHLFSRCLKGTYSQTCDLGEITASKRLADQKLFKEL